MRSSTGSGIAALGLALAVAVVGGCGGGGGTAEAPAPADARRETPAPPASASSTGPRATPDSGPAPAAAAAPVQAAPGTASPGGSAGPRSASVPAWATAVGEDPHGRWADLTIAGVTQRMRWIKPGTFMMGSPDSEKARGAGEAQSEVTLTAGYWLADSETTQGLWMAVMGANPSHFKAREGVWQQLPVEQVSWNDVQGFLTKLNAQVPGLNARLPTEAEWEYACRAGSRAALTTGPLTILGPNNGPELDPIAWYGGNSGQGLEVTNPADASSWEERQYPDAGAGTHRVKTKAANAWGLYDMHGNVLEWCSDWYDAYPESATRDPAGPSSGSLRVLRGGGWLRGAAPCRSAFRNGDVPDERSSLLGFRIAAPATP